VAVVAVELEFLDQERREALVVRTEGRCPSGALEARSASAQSTDAGAKGDRSREDSQLLRQRPTFPPQSLVIVAAQSVALALHLAGPISFVGTSSALAGSPA
jgi:hypothetical protein